MEAVSSNRKEHMTTLIGHTTPETAYVVEDYPYGFRLRCKIRYWLEYKRGQGYRLVSQTTNPKIAGREVWNKPKASTYAPLAVMVLDAEQHVTWIGVRPYELADVDAFAETHAAALTGEVEQGILRHLRAMIRASKRLTWTVNSGADGKPRQTDEEQRQIIHAVTMDELRKDGQ